MGIERARPSASSPRSALIVVVVIFEKGGQSPARAAQTLVS